MSTSIKLSNTVNPYGLCFILANTSLRTFVHHTELAEHYSLPIIYHNDYIIAIVRTWPSWAAGFVVVSFTCTRQNVGAREGLGM